MHQFNKINETSYDDASEIRSYRRKDIPSYRIRFITQNEISIVNRWEGKAFSIEDAIDKCKNIIGKNDKIVDIESIIANGKKVDPQDLQNIKIQCLSRIDGLDECDGGAGAAAGAGAGSGDGGGASTAIGGDGVASSGISSSDVLGHCDHESGQGYFGPDCFHIPHRAIVPFHRWEIGNGGSIRKTTKKGKKKKTPYEKGMKVVIDMFNESDVSSIDPIFVYGITPDQCVAILDTIENANPHYDRMQFMKYLDKTSSVKYECVGCFDKHTKICLAIAILDYNVANANDCYICEIQSFQKGFGKWLIQQILKNKTNVWLMANPGIDELLTFYRDLAFNLKEHVVENSIYDTPTHFFYQATQLEEKILQYIDQTYTKQ